MPTCWAPKNMSSSSHINLKHTSNSPEHPKKKNPNPPKQSKKIKITRTSSLLVSHSVQFRSLSHLRQAQLSRRSRQGTAPRAQGLLRLKGKGGPAEVGYIYVFVYLCIYIYMYIYIYIYVCMYIYIYSRAKAGRPR